MGSFQNFRSGRSKSFLAIQSAAFALARHVCVQKGQTRGSGKAIGTRFMGRLAPHPSRGPLRGLLRTRDLEQDGAQHLSMTRLRMRKPRQRAGALRCWTACARRASVLVLADIHRMTALLRPRLPVSTDFGNANSSARGSRAPKPVTFTRRAPKMWILLSSRRTSPLVFDGMQRFTSMRLPAAAAVPRSAAGCRQTDFAGWRPRPSGMRRSAHG
jgi:hypothetical protein